MLLTWIAAGSPKGECDRSLPAPKAPPVGDTHSVIVPTSWTVPAEGGPNWGRRLRDKRTFVLPLGNAEPLRVIGVAHHTSSPNLVHAVTYASDDEGRARWLDEREEGEGYRIALANLESGRIGIVRTAVTSGRNCQRTSDEHRHLFTGDV